MIEKAILDNLSKYSLWESGTTVTVALSGGADSVALLYALSRLKENLNFTLKAAHLNHLIRGDEAFRDEEFVKKLCVELNIPLFCERIAVPIFAKDNNLSLEAAARRVRYDFLSRISEGVIATAHTASDNLETVILNLTRGTAIDGLCGIPVKRDYIVRPIISATRNDVEDYCKKHGLSFVTDSTNLVDDYTRNKIRHQVIPVLREINPRVESGVLRTSSCLKQISDMLKAEAEAYINEFFADNKLCVKNFNTLNPEIAKRVITLFINRIDGEISLESKHIESIYNICLTGGKVSIPKMKHCQCEKDILQLDTEGENTAKKEFQVKISKKIGKINNLLLNNSLDCDKIVGKLVVRTRQSGDSIRLANRGCTKSLTKLYNECAVPLYLRDTLPVIADDKGVIWIYTIGTAQRCAVSKNTKDVFEIEVKENGVL